MSILSEEAVKWLASGERGTSSNTMFQCFTGVPSVGRFGGGHPSDPDDFRRCEKLLRDVPEFRECLPAMSDCSEVWAKLVERWDDIVALMEEEVPGVFENPRGTAHRSYELMKSLGC